MYLGDHEDVFFIEEREPETCPEPVMFDDEQSQMDILFDKSNELESIEKDIFNNNGVNQAAAMALESISGDFFKLRRNIKSYTQDYTLTNLRVTLEDMETIRKGVRVGLLAVMIAIIAKIGKYIYDVWKGNRDAGRTPGKLGSQVNAMQKVRVEMTRKHSDLIHNTLNVHNNLVEFVNERMGDKLPKKLTASNIKEILDTNIYASYQNHISPMNTILMSELVSGAHEVSNAIHSFVAGLNHLETVENVFKTISAIDGTKDLDFKATNIGFNDDKITTALSNLKKPFNKDSDKTSAEQLQIEVHRITKIAPDTKLPTQHQIESFDYTVFGNLLDQFNYDECLSKNEKLRDEVSAYSSKVASADNKNPEIDLALKKVNLELINYGKMLNTLSTIKTAFTNFVDRVRAAETESLKFQNIILETIAKSKDILTPGEVEIIKKAIKDGKDRYGDAKNNK